MWSPISVVDTTRYSKLTRPCSVGIDLLSPTDCSAVAQAPITRVPNVRSERQRRALLAPSEQWTAHVAYVGIGVGNGSCRPRPPNRACGSPAHGSPVGGFLIGIGSPTQGCQ